VEEFETRGWCSDPVKFQGNWINTVGQSLAKQGTHRGTMHPTRDGHTAVSERIEDRLETLLNGGTLQSDPCPDEPASAP
jgi:phospholipase/lecithinase/hemolysin